MSEDDVSARDALAVAQRALARTQEVEESLREDVDEHDAELEALREEVTALQLRVSELDEDRSASDLSPDEKVGKVREHAFRKAANGHGRATLDYDAIKWEVFDGEIGDSTCYRLIRKAAGLDEEKTGSRVDGFIARDPSDGNYHLAVDAREAKRSTAFSAGKIETAEEVR
ncbi:hypothetical protein [Haloparvum sedimenti]|uniref:hypothetical protein n=1 Tax=Haloparvum sedimenti TaxID=1678448 RepID=UPI00071E720E|nr:hypothetical protein [Haloparvum sedimenti]